MNEMLCSASRWLCPHCVNTEHAHSRTAKEAHDEPAKSFDHGDRKVLVNRFSDLAIAYGKSAWGKLHGRDKNGRPEKPGQCRGR